MIRKEGQNGVFFLKCDGNKFSFKFLIIDFTENSEYRGNNDFLSGKDSAIAVLRIDKSDSNFDEAEFQKIIVSKYNMIKQSDLDKLKSIKLRVEGYPIHIFNSDTENMEVNNRALYKDEGHAHTVILHDNGSSATLRYRMNEIVTSKGQSGGSIYTLNEDLDEWEKIGFYTGTHKDMNVG